MRPPSIIGDAALCQRILRPACSAMRSLLHETFPDARSNDCRMRLPERVKTCPAKIVGVQRGPSPPLFSGVPESPPPSYFTTPSGAAQSSLPVFASSVINVSCAAPSISRRTSVQARPPATLNELNPPAAGTFHSTFGPLAGHGFVILS